MPVTVDTHVAIIILKHILYAGESINGSNHQPSAPAGRRNWSYVVLSVAAIGMIVFYILQSQG